MNIEKIEEVVQIDNNKSSKLFNIANKSEIAKKIKFTKDIAAISYLSSFLDLLEQPDIIMNNVSKPAYFSMGENKLKLIAKHFMNPNSSTEINSQVKVLSFILSFLNSEDNIVRLKANKIDLSDL